MVLRQNKARWSEQDPVEFFAHTSHRDPWLGQVTQAPPVCQDSSADLRMRHRPGRTSH